MRSYYKKRAPVYDRVYRYPERQDDLRVLEGYISNYFRKRDVLEIAAGTGYWTQFIAPKARSTLVTDAIADTLLQAKYRPNIERATFLVSDAYKLEGISGKFSGLFAGLWLSHVPKERLSAFLNNAHEYLEPGTKVLFVDNTRAQCARLPIAYKDETGNTYQNRELDDGTLHRVLKNFPTGEELIEASSAIGVDHKYFELENYWVFQYLAK